MNWSLKEKTASVNMSHYMNFLFSVSFEAHVLKPYDLIGLFIMFSYVQWEWTFIKSEDLCSCVTQDFKSQTKRFIKEIDPIL